MRLSLLILSPFILWACTGLHKAHQLSEPASAEMHLALETNIESVPLPDKSDYEAARIDPDILLRPDTSVDAKIRVIVPPEDVDPAMVIPDIGGEAELFREDR